MRQARYDDDAQLDEVVADDVATFHLEKMNDGAFWIGLEHTDGSMTHISIFSRSGRAALSGRCDFEFVQIQERDK